MSDAWSPTMEELLVGREEELTDIVSRFLAARGGEGAIIGIRGDTGIGKSRLARAAAHAAMQFDFRVVWGATRPQSAIPYGPLRELFSSILADPSGGIHGASEPTATWKTIREMGSRLDISETDRLHLGHLLHAGEAASALGHVEGRALQWNTMAAIRSWILAMSREAPQLVIFEDMHLSDPMTRQAIDFLAKGIGLSRSVVLLLYRRGYTPPAYAREMVLGGLTMDGMRDLVRGLLKSAELASELGPLLWERTLGNPLHAEEALRHLSECGVLSESPRLMASQIQQLPESLEMIVNAGLSRIHGRARHVLDVASVLGSTFSEDVLACVDAGAPELLPELASRAILARAATPSSYRFRSSLLREVAYQGVPENARRELHRRVAEGLARITAEPTILERARIGHHLERAGLATRAAASYLDAARRALALHAYPDAEALYESYLRVADAEASATVSALLDLAVARRALGWIAEASELTEAALGKARHLGDRELECRCLTRYASLLRMSGRVGEARMHLEEALEALNAAGGAADRGSWPAMADVLKSMAVLERERGAAAEAQRLYERALEVYRSIPDRRSEAVILGSLAALAHDQGRMRVAEEQNEQALAIHREVGDRRAEAIVLANIASLAREHGRMEEALDRYEAAIAIHREVGDRRSLGVTVFNLANLHGEQGRLETAMNLAEQALRIHREVGNRRTEGAALGFLAAMQREQGRTQGCGELLAEAIAIHREVDNQPFLAVDLAHQSEVELSRGHTEAAYRLLEESIALHRQVGDPRGEGISQGKMAALLCENSRWDEAGKRAQRAVELAVSVGDRRSEALALMQLAAALRGGGADLEESERHLARAASLLSAVGDPLELAKCLCQQGHTALAAGRSGRPLLELAEALAQDLQLRPAAPLLKQAARLRRSVEAQEAGQPLWRGEALQRIGSN